MVNTPEQLVQLQQETLDTFQAVALKSIEGFEKLADLNIQTIKTSLSESNDQTKALFGARDAKSLGNLASGVGQPAAEKAASYAKHVYEIASDTGMEIAKLFEKQFTESNKQFTATIEALAKNAPAGSEGLVTLMKSAMNAANTTYEQANKAAKQAVELAEANMAAATKTAHAPGKKAA